VPPDDVVEGRHHEKVRACALEFVVTMDALKDRKSGQARTRVTGLTPRFDEVFSHDERSNDSHHRSDRQSGRRGRAGAAGHRVLSARPEGQLLAGEISCYSGKARGGAR
jgi:hypothetical protein